MHEQNFIKNSHGTLVLLTGYPIIPWIGVMALGYAFGSIIKLEASKRKGRLWPIYRPPTRRPVDRGERPEIVQS